MYKPSKPYKHKILEEIKKTWHSPYLDVHLNTYPIFKDKILHRKVDHTDGIGTKGLYHWQKGTFREAVIDVLAMNLNDLAMVRAVPYKLSNHITVPIEDRRVLKIVEAIVRECRKYKIVIVGGENSFHDNMKELDISMTVSGFIKKPAPNKFQVGDVLIGLKSSGLHSNGLTKVRQIFGKKYRKEFTVPTRIYLYDILKLAGKCQIHGMMHITGGAFTKLKDILGTNADALINQTAKLKPQKIFYDLHAKGISSAEMYRTFNCGTGFIVSVPKSEVEKALSILKNSSVIGRVIRGSNKVYIKSRFSNRRIIL